MTAPLLHLDPETIRAAFPDLPFAYRHGFADHPLFTLEALAELAASHPRHAIEWNSGKLAQNQDPAAVPKLDLDPPEAVRRIETCGAWMAIKRAERHPAFRAVVDQVLDEAARTTGRPSARQAAMGDPRCFVFVSSAGSVTPFHSDPEENFFIHIRGRKFFHVFDNRDRALASEADLEHYPGKHRNLAYRPDFEARATVYDLQAGDGIFVPYSWPHWVRTGDSYTVSMQITFKSPPVQRQNKLRTVNGILRRLGLPQPPPGRAPALDSVKVAAFDAAKLLLAPLRRRNEAVP